MNTSRDRVTFAVGINRVIYDRYMKNYGNVFYPVDRSIRMYSLTGKGGRTKHQLYAFIRERYY